MTFTEIEEYIQDLFIINGYYKPFKVEFYYTNQYAGMINIRKQTITISMWAMARLTDEQLKDTLLHEFAHFLSFVWFGELNHDYYFQECCELLQCDSSPVIIIKSKKTS